MVNFKKRLSGKSPTKSSDPVALYETLDRAHDKGPLRPAQIAVLSEWHAHHRNTRDIIVKLHTGQGKTLIGLLMLQARLNAGMGPVVYLCPDNFLIGQTCEQAKQFGIKTCTAPDELPDEFLNSGSILVTSVQKLFNGLTKFRLHKQSIGVDTVLMDDAHACIDRIREACRIRIPSDEPVYATIRTLFSADLEQQGVGTYADLVNGNRDALMPVPYWAWKSRLTEVAGALSAHSERRSVKFAWPLLKDILEHCQCLLSGAALEIEPYLAPLSAFGSYSKARHRIFMSATVTDDAFLIKGLQLSPQTVKNPLSYERETWSGEKMVLLPSLIHEDLDREHMVARIAKPSATRKYGVVALVPSFARTADWKSLGATIADKDTVGSEIDLLKQGDFERTRVLVNRYDGIDLPDETCRLLVFDSRPYSESFVDLYEDRCRANSEATLVRTIRTIEQGMGRSVRGEKDYSVVIAIGTDLVRLLRERGSRKYLSSQLATQIEIGLEIAELARQEIEEGKSPDEAFGDLVRQSLRRDVDWKAFYSERMAQVKPARAGGRVLEVFAAELEAEQAYCSGDYDKASDALQAIVDSGKVDSEDSAWYLQERARYLYLGDRTRSQALQVAAHRMNHLLLKPPSGVTVAKLALVSHGRTERIAAWIRKFESYDDLATTIGDICGNLSFGVKADSFEEALNQLSYALGFVGERPDAEWKEGPDNLWALDDRTYLLFECKSEVDVQRAYVNKREAEQVNRSSAWFDKHYPGVSVKRLLIHPAAKVESAAAFTHPVEGMREVELSRLTRSVREFFKSFESHNFRDLSSNLIQKLIDAHHLAVDDMLGRFSKKLRDVRSP